MHIGAESCACIVITSDITINKQEHNASDGDDDNGYTILCNQGLYYISYEYTIYEHLIKEIAFFTVIHVKLTVSEILEWSLAIGLALYSHQRQTQPTNC